MSVKIPQPAQSLTWSSAFPPAVAQSLYVLQKQKGMPVLLITPDTHTMSRYLRELPFFLNGHVEFFGLPDWEILPYDHFSPHKDIIANRIETLRKVKSDKPQVIIAPISTVMQRLAPQAFVQNTVFELSVGGKLYRELLKKQLLGLGYHFTTQVMEPGEFSMRGSVIDLYPTTSLQPYRIDLFDDEIDSIHEFSLETQRSGDAVAHITLAPAKEFPCDRLGIRTFQDQWENTFANSALESPILKDVLKGALPQGIEFYFPLFFDNTETLFDYLPKDTLLIFSQGAKEGAQRYYQHILDRFENLRHDILRPILPPEALWINPVELFSHLKSYAQIKLDENAHKNDASHFNLPAEKIESLHIDHKNEHPLHAVSEYIKNENNRILFTAESAGRQEVLSALLIKNDITPIPHSSFESFLESNSPIGICIANLDEGMRYNNWVTIISETQLYGDIVKQRRRRKADQGFQSHDDIAIKSVAELQPGDAVVHRDHGVGRYVGLQTIETGDHKAEYLTVSYKNEDLLYVPIYSLGLISRYSAAEMQNAPLYKLGSEKWDKSLEKAQKRIHDVAAELLSVYAKREISEGCPYTLENLEYERFASDFPFEETPDQEKAIRDVILDLKRKKPMDRLICGDVGFGKTEVAMRAAYVAIANKKQVAVIVPTTLLADQHYQNFLDRFANVGANIGVLSRFRTKAEEKDIIIGLKTGRIDIVIGTHKLLNPDIRFNALGLVIIDEEHRFGVRQKEKLKSLRTEVNILTLTATPIPRTLNLALSEMRDLSVIATPPLKRLSVKTFVHARTNAILKEALARELLRGGQVFFLHNDIKTIERTAESISELIPEARVNVAHGQMPEKQLEKIMSDFYHQRFNVLVCTTIIETGIDIPTANTIIIDRADKLGLAQLHQLRGRVGRSHHQAYAYLMVPEEGAVTKDAEKRLFAIQQAGDLGAGFTLATYDLEIRGAGELLGDEQSGQMHEIGYSLYMELLDRTIQHLKQGIEPTVDLQKHRGVEINLHLSALLPDDYIEDVHSRLQFYKRISHVKTQEALDDIKIELIDRFGKLPFEAQTLFHTAELRIQCEAIGIQTLTASTTYGKIEFLSTTPISPMTLIQLVQSRPSKFKLKAQNTLTFTLDSHKPPERFSLVEKVLVSLK